MKAIRSIAHAVLLIAVFAFLAVVAMWPNPPSVYPAKRSGKKPEAVDGGSA